MIEGSTWMYCVRDPGVFLLTTRYHSVLLQSERLSPSSTTTVCSHWLFESESLTKVVVALSYEGENDTRDVLTVRSECYGTLHSTVSDSVYSEPQRQ